MDRPTVHQVPEGSGEQRKLEETGCEIICAAPTTLVVKGLMMMIIMSSVRQFSLKILCSYPVKLKQCRILKYIKQDMNIPLFLTFAHIPGR